MTGPFAEGSIVVELETGRPERLLGFDPDGLEGSGWFHRFEEFDPSLGRETVVDRYALPGSDEYDVTVVEVPEGESLQLGSVAAMHGRSGGGDLLRLTSRDAVPEDWILEETTLAALLD